MPCPLMEKGSRIESQNMHDRVIWIQKRHS
jgi:hypothetical protein